MDCARLWFERLEEVVLSSREPSRLRPGWYNFSPPVSLGQLANYRVGAIIGDDDDGVTNKLPLATVSHSRRRARRLRGRRTRSAAPAEDNFLRLARVTDNNLAPPRSPGRLAGLPRGPKPDKQALCVTSAAVSPQRAVAAAAAAAAAVFGRTKTDRQTVEARGMFSSTNSLDRSRLASATQAANFDSLEPV